MRDCEFSSFCLGAAIGLLFGALLCSIWSDYRFHMIEQRAIKAGVAHHEINQDSGRVELMFHPAKADK